jgi:hypothetical protein
MEISLKALGREGTHTETKDFREFTDYVKDRLQIIALKYLVMFESQHVRQGQKHRSFAIYGQKLCWKSEVSFGFRNCIGDILTLDEKCHLDSGIV